MKKNATPSYISRKIQKNNMKSWVITILIILFTGFWFTGTAGNDDCPCRKKRAPVKKYSVVKTKKAAPVKSVDKKWDRYLLYPYGYYYLPEGVDYSYGKMKEIENFKVRIMPNLVVNILNVIYNTGIKGTVTIELLSSDGKLVKTLLQKNESGEQTVHSFDIEGKVSKGIAYVRFRTGNIVKVEQFFIF